jgi:pimeloyl-ACP methyl ester carboxylesterase
MSSSAEVCNTFVERAEFESAGRRLVGYLFGATTGAVATSRPGVLFIHGYASDQRGYKPRAEAAATATGGVSLTFDLSGHGASADPRVPLDSLSASDHYLDAMAAYDRLAALPGVDARRIGVCGASYGAYLAARLVSDRPVERLLLRAPALGADMRVPATLATYQGSVLLVESGRDEVVPHTTIAAYIEACGGQARHEVIEGATHALTEPQWQRRFIDLIVEWSKDL